VSGKLQLLSRLLPRLAAAGHRVLLFSQFREVLTILEDFMDSMTITDELASLPKHGHHGHHAAAAAAAAPTSPAAAGAGRQRSVSAGSGSASGPGSPRLIPKAFRRGRKLLYARIDGLTDGKRRQRIIDAFNKPESRLFALLMTTRAGGMGLNLASADSVILFDSDWNPHMDRQAMARAHRFGQTKPVVVYRLVTEGTVEERIITTAAEKLKMEGLATVSSAAITDGADGAAPAKSSTANELTAEELAEIVKFGAVDMFKKSALQQTKTT
jgi:SNF2 family DNA or RNA helicase